VRIILFFSIFGWLGLSLEPKKKKNAALYQVALFSCSKSKNFHKIKNFERIKKTVKKKWKTTHFVKKTREIIQLPKSLECVHNREQ
jgi:hypothetical protein